MKISIALAAYNGEKYIARQLQSLYEQTRRPDEVMICDDASADATAEIVREFIASHDTDGWRLSVNPKNLGFAQNFRQAVSLCTGDIVFLCDQDDIWDSNKISLMSSLMERDGSILALAAACRYIDSDDEPADNGYAALYGPARFMKNGTVRHITGKVFYANVAQGCACSYRREICESFLNSGLLSGLPHDWALNLTAFHAGGLYYLNTPLLSYRLHGDNAIGALTSEQTIQGRAATVERFLRDFRASSMLAPEECSRFYSRYAEYTDYRLELLRSPSVLRFLKGFVCFPEYALGRSFLPYCKDMLSAKTVSRRADN